MKPLKPSHREKKRYLLIKGKNTNKKNIEEAILEFIGVLGYAATCPQFISASRGKIVLCINRAMLEKVRTSFLMSGKDIQVVKVSGAVKKLK
jgi:RNase P/RNase MRP subunit POP5